MLALVVERPNWELSSGHVLAANLIFGVVALGAVAFMVSVALREGKRYPVFMLLGAGLAVVYEPINNVLGLCTYPEINQITWIETLGRKIPSYIGFVYFFYFSATIFWIMRRIARGVTIRQWWTYYAAGVVICTSFELIPIQLEWWRYYGDHQGLRIMGFPMWWWFANPMCLFGMATLFHFLRRHVITDRLSPMFVPLYPMALFAIHGSAGIPVFTALHSSRSTVVTSAATILTIGLSIMVMWITGRLVTVDAGGREPVPGTASRQPEVRQPATV